MINTRLSTLTRDLAKRYAFCGIGIAAGQEIGFSTQTATGISADPDTLFRAASISKIVVGQALAAVVKTTATTWQSDASDILGWELRNPSFPDQPITLGMLASHSAGLTDDAGYILPADARLVDWFQDRQVFAARPGTAMAYCNLGYIILADVVEKLSGKPFLEAVRAVVPNGAGFNWVGVPAKLRENRLPTYRREADGSVLCGWHLQSKTFFEAISNLSDTVLCSACSRGA